MLEGKVVLYPTMLVSHMIPMVQLAKLFIKHGISVEIAVINSPTMPTSMTYFISKISSTNPEISFNLLPPLPPPPKPSPTPYLTMLHTIQSNSTQLQSYLQSQSKDGSIAALVVDFFCVDALDVAASLGIPAYIFFSSGANVLAVFLRIPELKPTWDKNDVNKNPVVIPGIPMLHVSDLPIRIVQFDTEEHKLLMDIYRRMSKAKGILINTFELLEHGAVKTLKDWLSLSNPRTPPAYCIGPLVTAADNKEIVNHPCLRWLDYQRKESVVLLAFGSVGNFLIEQLQEIAYGIEKSGQKFIWVVRNPESNNPDRKPYNPLAEPDLDALLPEGFMNRTKEQGIVMKSWAPQVQILHHEAVGGFVNHCGWSSILEAITNGVPIICWPLFAEQKMNRFLLVEEMKIGVKLKGCDEGFVSRDELAEKVRWLMESEGGQELRNNVHVHRINGLGALTEGGSSETALFQFLENLK